MMSKICGHRGASKYKPENTISGFEWCVKNNINWSECDVQLTDENIALIIHDQTLDRTSNTNGMVKKVKLDELESINVGTVNSNDTFFQKSPHGINVFFFPWPYFWLLFLFFFGAKNI